MKRTLLLSALLTAFSLTAQNADTLPKNWRLKVIYGINGSQTSFFNWNAGGRNNVAVLGFVDAIGNYKNLKGNFKWDNDLHLALGAVNYLGKIEDGSQRFQKTDDRIEFNTNAGLRLKKHYYLSLLGNFRTQSLDGFAYPNDSIPASRFMAPGYATIALGIDYKPTDNFSLFISPLASKMTFVKSDLLANQGAFGVEAATYDSLGNLLKAGKQFRGEFGAYLQMKYSRNLAKNIDFKCGLQLFTNYIDNPQNIDVNAEALFSFKINSWLSSSLQWNLIYDDDIKITDRDKNVGPRTQFKSVFGLGVAFSVQNYIDEKK
jgi:opacity protein-like surface antigen